MKSLIFYHSAEFQAIIARQLASVGVELVASANNYQYGYDIVKNHLPDVVFVEITDLNTFNRELIKRMSLFEKNITLYGFTSNASIAQDENWAYLGIRKVLILPQHETVIGQMLQEQFESWQAIHSDAGKIITVYSNKGGLGKTSLSVNLATSLAQLNQQSVALIDLNLQLGDIATFLDLNPKYTISDISKNIERLDEDYIKSSFEKYTFVAANHTNTIYVLADPISVEQCEEISAEHINTIITLCKDYFDFVVIDLSSTLDNKTITAIDLADHVLLVTLANLPSIKSANRVLSLFKQLEYMDEKVKVILNRYSRNDEITPDDIADVLNKPIFAKIENNYQLMCASINKGEPIVSLEPSSIVNNAYMKLAKTLAAQISEEKEPVGNAFTTTAKPKKSVFSVLRSLTGKR